MSSSDSDTNVQEDGAGVELDGMDEEVPVRRKHLTKLLRKVTGMAVATKGYNDNVVQLQGRVEKFENRLDRIDKKGKSKATVTEQADVEVAGSSRGKAKKKLQLDATEEKKDAPAENTRRSGRKKSKKPSKTTEPNSKRKWDSSDGSGEGAKKGGAKKRKNEIQSNEPKSKGKPKESSDDSSDEANGESGKDEGKKAKKKQGDRESDESSQPDDKSPSHNADESELGAMPLPDLTSSIEHTAEGRIICKNMNGAGHFLRYDIPEDTKYLFKQGVMKSAYEKALTTCGLVDYEGAINTNVEWKFLANMVVSLLMSEYEGYPLPILLTKEVVEKFTEDEKQFATVIDLQPMPISAAISHSYDFICTKIGKSVELDVIINALPTIAKFVTGMRGGTAKLSSPVKWQ